MTVREGDVSIQLNLAQICESPASASRGLGLQVCTTILSHSGSDGAASCASEDAEIQKEKVVFRGHAESQLRREEKEALRKVVSPWQPFFSKLVYSPRNMK